MCLENIIALLGNSESTPEVACGHVFKESSDISACLTACWASEGIRRTLRPLIFCIDKNVILFNRLSQIMKRKTLV